jgi:hypothetical protein
MGNPLTFCEGLALPWQEPVSARQETSYKPVHVGWIVPIPANIPVPVRGFPAGTVASTDRGRLGLRFLLILPSNAFFSNVVNIF